MKKAVQIIVFSLLVLVCITFVIFGQIKTSEAHKDRILAEEAMVEAEALRNMAQQQAIDAAAHARETEAHALDLAAQLKKCQSK